MTIKDLQRLVESQPDYNNPEQQSQLERLRGKAFWHWDRGEHKQKIVSIKYVNGKKDHLNNQEKKLLQDIKDKGMEDAEAEDKGLSENSEMEEEQQQIETTTNGVF